MLSNKQLDMAINKGNDLLKGKGTCDMEWKRNFLLADQPRFLLEILCKLGLKHNWLLLEAHTHKKDKTLPILKWKFKYECVYCHKIEWRND